MQASETLARWRAVVAQAEDGAAAQPDLSESSPRRIPAILHPTTLREVQDIVDAARANGTPLYSVSTGMNWGLGSRHPVRDDCALVDLRRLDRIRDLNLAHGYAFIEAGVSQHALAQQLEGTPWMLNVTTSCKDSS
nr:FAD-dependent oxidoreductase [Burkholderiaceae bacterium]